MKSRKMRWVVRVAYMGNRGGAYMIFTGRPDERNHLEELVVDGRIILK